MYVLNKNSAFLSQREKRFAMSKPELVYHSVRARIENIRMMYAYAGKTGDYVDTTEKGFGKKKANNDYAFDQLPVMLINGTQVPQSGSITRLVAKQLGLYPEDPVEGGTPYGAPNPSIRPPCACKK